MRPGRPKQIRRQILELLYDRYARDPMHSLLPAELFGSQASPRKT